MDTLGLDPANVTDFSSLLEKTTHKFDCEQSTGVGWERCEMVIGGRGRVESVTQVSSLWTAVKGKPKISEKQPDPHLQT